jgi:hypothetical protein
LAIAACLLSAFVALLQGAASAAGEKPCARALIIGSETPDPKGAYARNMTDWMNRFVQILVRQRVPVENIQVLAETADPQARPPVKESTLANVQAAFAALKKTLKPDDQFVLFIVGHGTVTEPVGKLCLPGPDLKATDLADLLDGLPTKKIVVLNCASGSAEFLEKCARPGRVVVSACGTKGEGNQTCFAEFLLMACEGAKADADADGAVTVLEAFNRGARDCINWYHRQYKIDVKPGTENENEYVQKLIAEGKQYSGEMRLVIVRTKEARRLFAKFYGGMENVRMFEPKPEDEEQEDSEPRFATLEDIPYKRESGEHAALEDRGETTGAVHWTGGEHKDLKGAKGEEGETAARTVLGNPDLLPEAK